MPRFPAAAIVLVQDHGYHPQQQADPAFAPLVSSPDTSMNRKRRRATEETGDGTNAAIAAAGELFQRAIAHHERGELDDAARLYKRMLGLLPKHFSGRSGTLNNLAQVRLNQGRRDEASLHFAQAIDAAPELLDSLGAVIETLLKVVPSLASAIDRVEAAWPRRPLLDELFDGEAEPYAALADDPLLLTVLTSTTLRHLPLEHVFTAIRSGLLSRVRTDIDTNAMEKTAGRERGLDLFGALAQQCFINEYVFSQTEEETARAAALTKTVEQRLRDRAPVHALELLVLAMYAPLHTLAGIDAIVDRPWPKAVRDVLTQQVSEPKRERELRETIPSATAIDDAVSLRVQQQYEQNPYPRWVRAGAAPTPTTIEAYLQRRFPGAPMRTLEADGPLDCLVAGCGTGRSTIELAQHFTDARFLAADLSKASLAYAKRKTPAPLAPRIDFVQADILKLDTLTRTFDVINASGVLHHMADPFAAWELLAGLLRPSGFMHVGLYSERARRDIVAARQFIAEHGFAATPSGIRQAREALAASPLRAVTSSGDFYGTSDCRDLLFHGQEQRMTIPQIKDFLNRAGLAFLGFDLPPPVAAGIRERFAAARWPLTDLDRWHEQEQMNPHLFITMYQFWVQKR